MARKSSKKGSRPGKRAIQADLFDLGGDGGDIESIPLHTATEERYLNYALSVITARALPDVRDGLKPVQRRILYTMHQQGLRADAKHRKCAKVVGDVMGNYHPHGDGSIYEALVRLAQPFMMRLKLVDGSGNFGSLDGDGAAAMRYTECRLAPTAEHLLTELGERTVDFRPTYDGSRSEPIVLPARLPNLLVNGSTGIAVGMATNIPPHQPVEVLTALLKLLKDPESSTATLCRSIKGPDFPTGGRILNSSRELREIYETGSGSVKLRARHEVGETKRQVRTLIVTSIPYAVNKETLVERMQEVIGTRKLPQLLDVRDVSADDVRIEIDVKSDADDGKILGYLYKHTPLQTSFSVNLTALVPTSNPEISRPERLGLREILWHFLQFRLEVETRKLENELRLLDQRIHMLEGFESVFDILDEIIAIIRASDGKRDAAEKIVERCELDAEQVDAILELKLYRLAKLEILVIRKELAEKRKRARAVRKLLADEDARWGLVQGLLEDLKREISKGPLGGRKTIIEEAADEPVFSAEDFILDEDAVVIVTRDGWIKRQREVKDLAKTKIRQGDEILAAEPGSTKATIVFFSNLGAAYSLRIADVIATTGHGEPVQKRFKLKDGERIVGAISLDERRLKRIEKRGGEDAIFAHAMAATSDGYGLRFGLETFAEPSTRSGRRYAKLAAGAEVLAVKSLSGAETLIAATAEGRALLCYAEEVNLLSGPGRGVILIKLQSGDRLLDFHCSRGDRDLMTVETTRGANQNISTAKYEVTSRGGRGREIIKQGGFRRVLPQEIEAPEPLG